MPVLRSQNLEISPSDVRRAAAALREGFARKYAVVVDGRPYPPKELLEAVLEGRVPRSSFTTGDALRIFRRLGFEVVRRPAPRLLDAAGCLRLGGDARRDAEAVP